jgi:hypothetical protein
LICRCQRRQGSRRASQATSYRTICTTSGPAAAVCAIGTMCRHIGTCLRQSMPVSWRRRRHRRRRNNRQRRNRDLACLQNAPSQATAGPSLDPITVSPFRLFRPDAHAIEHAPGRQSQRARRRPGGAGDQPDRAGQPLSSRAACPVQAHGPRLPDCVFQHTAGLTGATIHRWYLIGTGKRQGAARPARERRPGMFRRPMPVSAEPARQMRDRQQQIHQRHHGVCDNCQHLSSPPSRFGTLGEPLPPR